MWLFLILLILIIIGLIVYFWATIWAILKIILGIAGVAAIIISIFRGFGRDDNTKNDSANETLFGIGLVLTIFFVIVPYWSVFKWILLGLGILLGIYLLGLLIVAVIENKKEEKRKKFIPKFKRVTGLHVSLNSFDNSQDDKDALELIEFIPLCEKKIKKSQDKVEKRKLRYELFNKKLKAFYQFSIKGECKGESYINSFYNTLNESIAKGNYNILRTDIVISNEFSQKNISRELKKMEKALKEDKIIEYTKQIKEISQTKTGWFSNTTSDKAQQMQQIYNAISEEAEELKNIGKRITSILKFTRIVAFRNSYLMNEVTNFLSVDEGKNLVTEKSVADLGFSTYDYNICSFNHFSIEASTVIENTVNKFSDTYNTIKGFGFSTKQSIKGGLLVAGALSLIDEIGRKNEEAIQLQKEILKQAPILCDQIQKGQAQLLDSIKIIRAINDANEAFLYCYSNLRDFIFVDKDLTKITKEDVLKLIEVKKRYTAISQTKIK